MQNVLNVFTRLICIASQKVGVQTDHWIQMTPPNDNKLKKDEHAHYGYRIGSCYFIKFI